MNTTKKLKVTMFGGLTINYGDSTMGDNGDHSSKLWNLLAYLIVNRHREISHGELIGILWEDDEDIHNPVGALKTLVHRTREMLGKMGLDGSKLILSKRGSYCWNMDEVDMYLDTELLEHLYHNAEKKRFSKESLSDLLKAAELYKGTFLCNLSSEMWVIPLSVYYVSRYISAVYKALDILSSQERYEDIIALCTKAISVELYNESLNIQLIDALVQLGRYQLALDHYRKVTDMLYQQFSTAPSEEFHALYNEIVKKTNLEEMCISDISDKIKSGAPKHGAYYCIPPVFQEICQYESRNETRSGGVALLGLFTIRDENGEGISATAAYDLSIAAVGLHNTIRDTLRCGDCFSQLNASQFGILLQNTTYEKGRMVFMRVIRAYYRLYPGTHFKLENNLKQLDPLGIYDA